MFITNHRYFCQIKHAHYLEEHWSWGNDSAGAVLDTQARETVFRFSASLQMQMTCGSLLVRQNLGERDKVSSQQAGLVRLSESGRPRFKEGPKT